VYNEAVEEALCYGWIDSIVKRIDDEKYCQKFTPRKNKSVWSNLNKERVLKLEKNNKMTKYGLEKVNIAKKNGMWFKKYPDNKNDVIPNELLIEIKKNSIAKTYFQNLSSSQRKAYINWINSAKKVETRIKRSREAVENLRHNKKLGMK